MICKFSPEAAAAAMPNADPTACMSAIYPVSDTHRTRQYQVNIVKEALLKNTMVVLPTGTGKTLVAAVVMYNFYRWFPSGKIVFLAPTRPLVAQQIEACRGITGAPEYCADSAELTGEVQARQRAEIWRSKRVLYCTPQVLDNDLSGGGCPAHDIVCLVVDEAHRAQGDHAYVTAVSKIATTNTQFRVLGLTATPGTTRDRIQQVITNLRIAHVMILGEEDACLKQYMHGRDSDVVNVPSDPDLERLGGFFQQVLRQCAQGKTVGQLLRVLKLRIETGSSMLRSAQLASKLEEWQGSAQVRSQTPSPLRSSLFTPELR